MVSDDLFNLVLEQSPDTALWRARWQGQDGDSLLYLDGDGTEIRTDGRPIADQFEAFLWDIAPTTVSEVYVERIDSAERYCSSTKTLEKSSLPAWFPEINKRIESPTSGYIATTITTEFTRGVAIFNSLGEVIWFYEVPYREEKVPLSHLHVFSDGVLFTENAPNSLSEGVISKVNWMGEITYQNRIQGLNIGFAVLDDDHYFALTSEAVDDDLDEDVLIEIIGVEQREVWRATEHFPLPDESLRRDSWVHSNYVHWNSDTNKILLSMEFINTVGQFDPATGDFDWLVSGLGFEDYDSLYHPDVIARPHSINHWRDGYLVFNRGNTETTEHACANIGFFYIEETVSLEQQIFFEPCVTMGFFGEAIPIQQEYILATWSDRGQINIYSKEGETHWQLNLHIGAVFGFSAWLPSSP